MKRNIFICGGHVTPAIALIDELAGDKGIGIIFVGRTYAVEYQLITQKRIRFLQITAGKRSWSSFVKIPVGFIQACVYCIRERPSLVVSFGGYVALPVSIAAWMLGIPVITHEQTLAPGLANKIIAKIARRVCVTFEETLPQFPKGKAVFTGLPMRKELFLQPKKTAYTIDEKNYPLIYITGGSLGAQSLNEKILPVISELTRSYTVIHQTGSATFINSKRYIVEPYISIAKLPWILQHAAIVIGRSGANTTMELAALGKVAILVPLPWSAGNEQLLHAKWLTLHGGAVVIEQHMFTPEVCMSHMKKIQGDYESVSRRAEVFARNIPRDGAKRLALVVRKLL